MTENKYLSLEGLTTYDTLLKEKINSGFEEVNASITKITNGSTVVDKANHAVSADTATSADSATKATQDASGNVITETYETKSNVAQAISTHNTATNAHQDIRDTLKEVKDDVDAFFKDATISEAAKDTLKEIQEYITSDAEAAAQMLEAIGGKADKEHDHTVADITDFSTEMAKKADKEHGTHVTYSTAVPVMDGTASVGSAATVARSDHKHPTDTSRASKEEFDTHTSTHAPSNAQANVIESIKVNGTVQTITSKAVNITVPTDNKDLTNGAGYLVASDIQEITSAEIQALFA